MIETPLWLNGEAFAHSTHGLATKDSFTKPVRYWLENCAFVQRESICCAREPEWIGRTLVIVS